MVRLGRLTSAVERDILQMIGNVLMTDSDGPYTQTHAQMFSFSLSLTHTHTHVEANTWSHTRSHTHIHP